jgi:hypothetical protein
MLTFSMPRLSASLLAPLAASVVAVALGAGCVTRTVYVVDDRDDPPARGGSGPVAQAEPAPEDDAGINSVDQFYEPLSPYGQWVAYPGYGMVFVPSVGVVGAGYRPYTNGHWEYTEWGWTWVDHHPFGWATGHYGRWFYDNGYGWVWVPGTAWSPAWVTWRTGGAYVGWAAMPPGSYYGARYSVYETSWVYVHSHHIGSPYVSSVLIVGPGYAVCYRETYPVYTTTVVHGRTYYRGPDYDRVTRDGARVTHRPVRETERERAVTRPPSGTTIARGRERSSDRDGTSGSRRTRDGRDDGSDGRGGGRDDSADRGDRGGRGNGGSGDRGGSNDGDRGHGNDRDRNDGDNPSRNPRNDLDDRGSGRGRTDADDPSRNPRDDGDSRGNSGRGSAKGDERTNSIDFPSGRGRDDASPTDDGPRSIAPENDGRGLESTRGPRPIDPIDDGAGVNPGNGTGRPDVTPDRGRDLPDLDRERDPRVDAVRPDNREQPNPERLRPIREPFPRDRFDGRTPGRAPSYEGTAPSRSSSPGGYDRAPSRAPSQPRMDAPSRAPSRGPSVGAPSAPSDSNNSSTPSKKSTSKSSKGKGDSKSSTKKR